MFVVVDIYTNDKSNRRKTNKKPLTGSILFNKRKSNTNRTNVITTDTAKDKTRSFPFSKLRSSIVASFSKKKSKEEATTTLKYCNQGELQRQNLSASTILHVDHDTPKPSLTARPYSQFIFPVKEEEDDVFVMETTPTTRRKLNKHHSQQQTKRHSIALDHFSQDQHSTPSSSRSSSLKTIRSSEPDILDKHYDHSSTLSRSLSQNGRLSVVGVARARTVLGLDSWKSKENQAMYAWHNTFSQLSSQEEKQQDYDYYNNATDKELYQILAHPALIPEDQLERQRFVRQPTIAKNHAIIKFILNELHATEKSYNQLLKLIKDRYMQPMVAASQAKDPLVKATDIPILFNHLLDFVDLSDKLLHQFESSTNNVGLIFRSLQSDLAVFIKYAMHYSANIKTIKRACNNVLFIKIDQENLARRDTNRLGMSDYFIAPIQRIPRYCLLIKDLQKYSDPLIANDLNSALIMLTSLAMTMDSVQSKSSRQSSLQTIKTL